MFLEWLLPAVIAGFAIIIQQQAAAAARMQRQHAAMTKQLEAQHAEAIKALADLMGALVKQNRTLISVIETHLEVPPENRVIQ